MFYAALNLSLPYCILRSKLRRSEQVFLIPTFLDDAISEANVESSKACRSFDDATVGRSTSRLVHVQPRRVARPRRHPVRLGPIPRSRTCKLQARLGHVEWVQRRFENSTSERCPVFTSFPRPFGSKPCDR